MKHEVGDIYPRWYFYGEKPGKFPVTGFTLPWHWIQKNLSSGGKLFSYHWLFYDLPFRRTREWNKLKKHDLAIFPCMSHKLQLAVHTAVTHTNVIYRLCIFVNLIYALSLRNCRLMSLHQQYWSKVHWKDTLCQTGNRRHFVVLTLSLLHWQQLLSVFSKLAETHHSQLKREPRRAMVNKLSWHL